MGGCAIAPAEGNAARDPLTISRAATIATVASLIVWRMRMVELGISAKRTKCAVL